MLNSDFNLVGSGYTSFCAEQKGFRIETVNDIILFNCSFSVSGRPSWSAMIQYDYRNEMIRCI